MNPLLQWLCVLGMWIVCGAAGTYWAKRNRADFTRPRDYVLSVAMGLTWIVPILLIFVIEGKLFEHKLGEH